ncbi:MAG TPA: glycosyltransferase family 39 protein [Candidatus Nanoarchaeia archaeon]|nr:glycosyltransferase family 39 protein [Candidatus Nanoarchaeia archaeon]
MEVKPTEIKIETKEQKKGFFSDKLNIIALVVISIGIIIRLYYLFVASHQPLWWDEAEMMLQAKHYAFNTPNTGWFPYREPLLPLFWGLLFKIGASEFFIRLIETLFSIVAVIFTYLLGKEIFDKKIGIIATAFLSVFYLHLFYSLRFMSEAPTLAFVTVAVYCFWKGYVKEINLKYLLFSGLSILIGFLSYYAVGFIGLVMLIYLLITDKFKFLKNRKVWIAAIIILILLLPYIFYSMATLGAPIPRLAAVQASIANPETKAVYSAWNVYLKMFPTYLQIVLLITFLLGLLYLLINLILGFDLMIKDKNIELKKDLFLLLWILIPLILLTYVAINTSGRGEDRYLIVVFPAVFIIAAKALMWISDYTKKFDKRIAIGFVVLIILIVGFQQLRYSDALIKNKVSSYEPIKLVGIWIKENSNKGEIVISNSIPQNTYYSERETRYAYEENEINKYKPRYFVVSIFENSGQAYFEYPEKHGLKPVQAYFADQEQKQALAVIYEFPKP